MTLEQRFTRILELLPDGASITLTRADIESIINAPPAAEVRTSVTSRSDWLTPEQVAKAIGRSPSRVRDLRADGHFKNADWNGKEYMTPPLDVEEYLKWRSKAYVPPKRKQPAATDRCAPSPVTDNEGVAGETPGVLPQPRNEADLSGWENALPEVAHRPERRRQRGER